MTELRATSPAQARVFIQDELDTAVLYEALAANERDARLAEVYRRLAATERRHAQHWIDKLIRERQPVAPHRLGWRTRVLRSVAVRFGAGTVVPIIAGQEVADAQRYANTADRMPGMDGDERSHALMLRTIAGGRGVEGPTIARLEGRHRAAGGNALRAAVLGANDGLLSNLSLVMGVAGASLSTREILVTGFAGLLAGASSMALGEWLSVQSSRELYERQIGIERAEIEARPEEEAEELALIYEAKGLAPEQARSVAARLLESEGSALDTLAREELGIDPNELGGSAIQAAVSSFALFAVGAIIPTIPFMFLSGHQAEVAALIASGSGLFLIGAAITVLTGRSAWYSGARQVIIGLAAAGLTFAIGRLIGVSLGG
jgi:VIT1/CCC1 family predicted Fe2+/Mn2+ transporter